MNFLWATALLTACHAAVPPPAPPPPPPTTTITSAPMPEEEPCTLVCGLAVAAPDVHAQDIADADRVFARMRDDLLACYRMRVREYPNAHASLNVEVVIGEDGTVQKVETTGGALLGNRTMRCITQRIEREKFEPVRGGGTLRVLVPLTFARTAPEEGI